MNGELSDFKALHYPSVVFEINSTYSAEIKMLHVTERSCDTDHENIYGRKYSNANVFRVWDLSSRQ